MKNFLVTGALGFIGSNFVNYMIGKYSEIRVIVLDKKDYCSAIENVIPNDRVKIIIGDIANKELVGYILETFEIDNIVHFAAQTHVDNSFYNSVEFTMCNVLGTHILLETTRLYQERTNRIEKFIHVSTDEVYGESLLDETAKHEKTTLDPTNPYAASKAAAEFFVKSYYYSYKLPIIITRGNNVYGINQYPEKIIPKFICLLLDNQKLTIQGTGDSLRNYIHVDDVCTAFETILLKGVIGEIYNISASESNEYSVMHVASTLLKLMDKPNDYIIYVPDRNFNDRRYFINSNKLKELGWDATKTDFENNLKDIIAWYSLNRKRFNS